MHIHIIIIMFCDMYHKLQPMLCVALRVYNVKRWKISLWLLFQKQFQCIPFAVAVFEIRHFAAR